MLILTRNFKIQKLGRKLNSANAKMSGSPIYISANTLAIAFPELVSLFEKYLQKYGAN